jgi:hypothetical protein
LRYNGYSSLSLFTSFAFGGKEGMYLCHGVAVAVGGKEGMYLLGSNGGKECIFWEAKSGRNVSFALCQDSFLPSRPCQSRKMLKEME